MNDIKTDLPIIPLRDVVIFPGIVTTLFVGRKKSIEASIDFFLPTNKVVTIPGKITTSLNGIIGKSVFISFITNR